MRKIGLLFILMLTLNGMIAQDEAESPELISVTNGEAVLGTVNYPVFTKVSSVEKDQFGGIRYVLTESNQKSAVKKAEQIRKFYQKRKISSATIGPFKKISKPYTIAWVAVGKQDSESFGVVLKVEESTFVVYVIPEYEEGVLAMIL